MISPGVFVLFHSILTVNKPKVLLIKMDEMGVLFDLEGHGSTIIELELALRDDAVLVVVHKCFKTMIRRGAFSKHIARSLWTSIVVEKRIKVIHVEDLPLLRYFERHVLKKWLLS